MNNSFPSIFLLAPLFGWFAAHLVKFLFILFTSGGRQRILDILFRSGGMPSSHSATMVATTTVIGGREGIGSALFALAVTVTVIVLYDAINVRRSVGQQGEVLRKLVAKSSSSEKFFIAYGHTFTEVVVGCLVGFAVGYGLLQIL